MYCISRVVMMEKVVVIDLRNFCETSKRFHKAAFIISFPVSKEQRRNYLTFIDGNLCVRKLVTLH